MKAAVVGVAILAASLVEGGEPPSEVEAYAASELRHWLGELAERGPDVEIRLGTRHLELFPEDRAFLADSDGFAVRRKDGAIYIVAPRPRGVLYGVYAFLERNSDLIWARPLEACGTVYSRQKAFVVRDADFRERPVFDERGWYICGDLHADAATERWNARMRCNHACADPWCPGARARAARLGFRVAGGCGHNLAQFLTRADFAQHPEWFGQYEGKRQLPSDRNQFCYSNLEGARAAGRGAARQIGATKHPFESYMIMQEDNDNLCTCETCQAPFALPDGSLCRPGDAGFKSERFRLWFAEMAKVIRAAYPDVRLDVYAYAWTSGATRVPIDDNINIVYCPFVKNDRRSVLSPENRRWADLAQRWYRSTTNLVWREYWGCGSEFPRPNSLVAAEDLKWISGTVGIRRVFSEYVPDGKPMNLDASPSWDASAMEFWVLSRLMWDPRVPVEQYRAEYLARTYRKAAPPMARFYATIAESWFADPGPSNCFDRRNAVTGRILVAPGLVEPLRACLAEARRLAADEVPATRRILERQSAHFEDLVAHAVIPPEPVVVPRAATCDWAKAVTVKGLLRLLPWVSRPTPAKLETEISLLHDGGTLYARFVCRDPHPALIWAEPSEGRKGQFPVGDHVELSVLAGEAGLVHVGVDVNGNRGGGVAGDYTRRFKWTSSAARDADGYRVEIALPLRQFGVELSRNNRLTAAFGRGTTRGKDGFRSDGAEEFSSWQAAFPNGPTGELVLELE